jgi:hypothetical protein
MEYVCKIIQQYGFLKAVRLVSFWDAFPIDDSLFAKVALDLTGKAMPLADSTIFANLPQSALHPCDVPDTA